MTRRESVWQGRVARGAVAVFLGAGCAAAHADQFGIQFAGGIGDHDVKKLDLGGVWDPGLQWWHVGGYHFTLVGEAHIAYWNVRGSGVLNPDVWEFGVTPVFRIIKDAGWCRPYFEAGAGVRVLSHARETADITLSSAFQFTEIVGVGAQFGAHQHYQVGYRFQHVSNADIHRPNPGMDFHQIYVQYNF
ncbi:MAG TPA: acyloxyacyl hydrolase [Paraburkholderia sp.]|jgi:lipid A 3-O-deacylase|nr:acyloxyacyl hydrolase [Paraburkholderia sp.]